MHIVRIIFGKSLAPRPLCDIIDATIEKNKHYSYNCENMAHESLPNDRKLFDYE